jgi:hypothetical protein
MFELMLEEHKGTVDTALGPAEVSLDQWRVYAMVEGEKNWKQIGYLSFDGGFAPIVSVHESFGKMLKQKLDDISKLDCRIGVISNLEVAT